MLVAPHFLCGVPDSDLNFSGVLTHVDSLGQQELNLDSDIGGNMSRWVRVGDVAEALLDSKNRAHRPLSGLFALLRVLVHLEVDDTSDDEIVLDLVWRQVVVTGPESAKHNRSTSLLLRQLGDMVTELDINTVLVSAEDISPDTEENIILSGLHVESLLASLITL